MTSPDTTGSNPLQPLGDVELTMTERVGASLLAVRLRQMLAGGETFTAVQAGNALLKALKDKGFTITKE